MRAAAAVLLIAGSSQTGAQQLPRFGEHVHLGVKTCAASTCHGAAEARESTSVLQNEYLTWHREDAHAEAYEALRSRRSRRIAERLGIAPPTEADTCLECHADNVPPERRGEKFQIEDGIGCEACHGGAEDWIDSHATEDATHEQNISRGLYPTNRPAARTRLCMSCHYSHPEAPMTHRLMGAGHPPLLFETDTFTELQPAHHRVDRDYRRRKRAPSAARTWAVGQATGAVIRLGYLRETLRRDGLFPELYHFRCASCHHRAGAGDWAYEPIAGRPPGSVPIADASLRMLGYALAETDAELAARWRDRLRALHRGVDQGGRRVTRVAGTLHELARKARDRLSGKSLDDATVAGMAKRIVTAGIDSGYADRTWSDQATMALGTLVTTLARNDALTGQELQRVRGGIDALYAALSDPDKYSPWRFREALRRLDEDLP